MCRPVLTEVDLRSDLGIRGQKGHGLFKVAVKPARKHRILFETVPYRLRVITRSPELLSSAGGPTPARTPSTPTPESITSSVAISTTSSAGRKDTWVCRSGRANFDATATVTSQRFGSSTEDGKAPMPLIGVEFRSFPIRGKNAFNLNGHVKE